MRAMRILYFFIFACVVGCGAMLVSTTAKDPVQYLVVGGVIWILFFAYVIRGDRKRQRRDGWPYR